MLDQCCWEPSLGLSPKQIQNLSSPQHSLPLQPWFAENEEPGSICILRCGLDPWMYSKIQTALHLLQHRCMLALHALHLGCLCRSGFWRFLKYPRNIQSSSDRNLSGDCPNPPSHHPCPNLSGIFPSTSWNSIEAGIPSKPSRCTKAGSSDTGQPQLRDLLWLSWHVMAVQHILGLCLTWFHCPTVFFDSAEKKTKLCVILRAELRSAQSSAHRRPRDHRQYRHTEDHTPKHKWKPPRCQQPWPWSSLTFSCLTPNFKEMSANGPHIAGPSCSLDSTEPTEWGNLFCPFCMVLMYGCLLCLHSRFQHSQRAKPLTRI